MLIIYLCQKQTMNKYTVIIEQDEDGMYVGTIPDIKSCYADGETIEAMLQNLKDVVQLCLRNLPATTGNKFVGIHTVEFEIAA